MKKAKLSIKIACTVIAILFGFLICATVITSENKYSISSMLGQKTYKLVENKTSEEEDTAYYPTRYKNLSELMADGRELIEDIEEEGAVLLKNDNNALPLQEGARNVSVFSVTSVDPAVMGGSGSADSSNPEPHVTVEKGFTDAGMSVNKTLLNFYETNKDKYKQSGCFINDAPWTDIEAASGVTASFSQYGDAAIIMLRRFRGEAVDMVYNDETKTDGVDGNYLKLSPNEISLFQGVAALKGTTFKKIIVLINSANHIQAADFLGNPDFKIDAAMWIGSVGQTGLSAVGNLLTGKVNPSGRLSDTYWNRHSDNPVMANFGYMHYTNYGDFELPADSGAWDQKGMKYSNYLVYKEGIYINSRYVETRYEDTVMKRQNVGEFDYSAVVAYPFGYGLSYTDFEYSDYKVTKKEDTYHISVRVTNVGETAGKETVQIYLQKPYGNYDIENKIEKASVELVGFNKTGILQKGESEVVNIEVEEREFAAYDANNKKTYVITDGNYYLAAGKNAHDALNNILAEKGYSENDGMDDAGNRNLVKGFELSFDSEKYSTSEATGNKITNLFDEADINKYSNRGSNQVTYVSRNNWVGTLPANAEDNVKLTMNQAMIDEMLAQNDPTTIVGDDTEYPTYGKPAGLSLIDMRVDSEGNEIAYNDLVWDTFMDQLTWDETAFLLSTGQRKTGLIESIAKPETVDHNGPVGWTQPYSINPYGLASKTNDPDKDKCPPYYPSVNILAATFNKELASRYGDMMGEDAIWSGYAGFYGLSMNTHRSMYDGRLFEYYSEDPVLTGTLASCFAQSLQSHGCSAYAKHIAAYEQQDARIGMNTWFSEQAFREVYLKPFRIAITKGGAKNAMTAYSRLGVVHCASNSSLVNGFLHGECGITGFVVTDGYKNGYVPEQFPVSLMAGVDLPDGDIDSSKPFNMFKTGYGNVAQRMREAAKRILYTVCHSNAMNGFSSDTQIVEIMPAWLVAITVTDVVLGALLVAGLAAGSIIVFKEKNN